MPVQKMVKQLITSNNVVIFSKSYCRYSNMAKEIFHQIDHKFTVVELDRHPDAEYIQRYLEQLTGSRTVPRVFVKGQCVGGFNDVQQLHNSGRLKSLLNKKK